MMLRRVASRSSPIAAFQAKLLCPAGPTGQTLWPSSYSHVIRRGFLDLHKMTNKEAIEKEKARLSDELSRGYFADISEMRKNGVSTVPFMTGTMPDFTGKAPFQFLSMQTQDLTGIIWYQLPRYEFLGIDLNYDEIMIGLANKTLIPEVAAVKFPELEVNLTDCTSMTLPVIEGDNIPDASLMCLSFRESSQKMIETWSLPFLEKFGGGANIQIYEVSFVDSWLLSLGPIKRSFIKIMKKSDKPQRQIVYAFGDHYGFRKKLQILNLLTGYVFLLDRLGRIRWQGFGSATDEEVSNLLSCTSLLLDDK